VSIKTIQEKLVNRIFNKRIASLYSSRFKKYGPAPFSVLWFNGERQLKRFEIIADGIFRAGFTPKDTIIDFGCGYGAFLEFLHKYKQFLPAHYYGLDLSTEMISFCQRRYRSKRVSFLKKNDLDFDGGFSVISGAFGRAATPDVALWESYVFSNLLKIWSHTKKAMVFNFQYTASSESKISSDRIYYISLDRLFYVLEAIGGSSNLIYDRSIPNDITVILRHI